MTVKNLLVASLMLVVSNVFASSPNLEKGLLLFQESKFGQAYTYLKMASEESAIQDSSFLISKEHELLALIQLGNFNQVEFEISQLLPSLEKEEVESKRYIIKRVKAELLLRKGQFQKGSILCDSLITYFKINNDEVNLATTYYLKGRCLSGNAEPGKAIDLQKQSRVLREKIFGPNHIALCEPIGAIAFELVHLKKEEEAQKEYERALAIVQSTAKNHPSKVYIYNGLGVLHRNIGNYEKATTYFEQAIKQNENMFGPSHFRNGSMSGNLSGLYEITGQFEKSIHWGIKTRAAFLEYFGPHHPSLARCNQRLATSYISLGKFDEAIMSLQNALSAVVPTLNVKGKEYKMGKEEVEPSFDLLLVLHDIAKAYLKKYESSQDLFDLEFADHYYDLSMHAIDLILVSYLEEMSKKSLLYYAKDIYEGAIKTNFLFYERHPSEEKLAKGFDIAERSKSSLLRASIQAQQALKFSSVPDSLKQKEEILREEIAEIQRLIEEERNKGSYAKPDDIKALEEKLFLKKQAFQNLLVYFKEQFKEYYKLKFSDHRIPFAEARNKLKENERVINYFLGKKNLYIIHFSKEDNAFIQVRNLNDLGTRLDDIVMKCSDRTWAEEEANKDANKKAFVSTSSFLYRKLISPLHLNPGEHLLIIPDGKLFYLPFEILMNEKENPIRDYGAYNYLVKDHPIRYDYSISASMEERSFIKKFKKDIIGFAPSYSETPRTILNETMNFLPLKNTIHEVHWLSQIFNATTFFDRNANESTFKDAENYKVQHLAMHGFLNSNNDLFSGLVFSNAETEEDDILYAYEIYDLKKDCELLCLSACNTGVGKLEKGEEVMSLGRAFRHAGSQSVGMSLWVSDDIQTRTLMQQFYSGLKEELTKDKALQMAKLSVLENNKKQFPHYWASFILMGSNDPIMFRKGFANYVWGGVLLITFLAMLLFLFRDKLFNRAVVD